MKPRHFLFVFLACVTLAASAQHINRHLNARSTQADAEGYYWMPAAVADDYFDGTSSQARVHRHMEIAKAVGARYLRCAFSWNAIEPQPGHYNWAFWDMLVSEAGKAHIQLIPYVAYTPEWAAATPHQFWKRPPTDPKLFADFMYRLASRYRRRIHSWELWNEPDISEYWMGTPDQFAQLVKLSAAAVRRADPDATIVLAGMSKGPSPFFQRLVQRYHIERYVDVVAMHGYPESWLEQRAETVLQTWLLKMNRIVARDGLRRDFWLNEIGYADYRYSPTQANKYGVSAVFPYQHTPQYAASALFKSQVMALESGEVSLTAWYRIDDFDPRTATFSDDQVNFHLGLVDYHDHPKPTFYALLYFNRLFCEPTRPLLTRVVSSLGETSDAVINAFEKQDGRIVVIGWLRSLNRREVPNADGFRPDTRRESVAVHLPCATVRDVTITDAQGNAAPAFTTFHNGWLDGIRLRPDRVFVAATNCSAVETQFASLLRLTSDTAINADVPILAKNIVGAKQRAGGVH